MTEKKENITNWIKNQIILVTGGTGQVGKILIYKLLSCNVSEIYIIVRPKRGKTAEERLKHLLSTSSAFANIRNQFPEYLERVKAIPGDTSEIELGLDESSRKFLQEKITVVFHAAASVSFDDPLRDAVYTNLRSTREMILLSQGMKKLQAFLHVSTAYTNIQVLHIEEKLYPPLMDWRKLIKAAETLPVTNLNAIMPILKGVYPNTYIFTKNVAEHVINEFKSTVPFAIFRPAIVLSPMREPEPGWMEAYTSPLAIAGASAQGVLRVYGGPLEVHSMYVPGDTTVYGMIAAAYKRAHDNLRPEDPVPIYNTRVVPISPFQIKKIGFNFYNKLPIRKCIWHPHFVASSSKTMYLLLHLLLHVLPGIFFDALFKFSGTQKISLVRLYRKLYLTITSLNLFITNEFAFELNNFKQLEDLIASDPQDNENFDMTLPDVKAAVELNAAGYRKFIGESLVPTAKDFQHKKRLYWIDKAFLFIVASVFIWIVPFGLIFKILLKILQLIIPL